MADTKTSTTTFTVTRHTTTSPDASSICLDRLHAEVGASPVNPNALMNHAASPERLKQNVDAAAGPLGFISMLELQHGLWFNANNYTAETASHPGQRYAPKTIVQLTFGNPILLGLMGQFDVNALLMGPIRLLVLDNASGGTDLIWDRPSTYMSVIEDRPEQLQKILEGFDARVEKLVNWVAYGQK